jgi:hypothetical protein
MFCQDQEAELTELFTLDVHLLSPFHLVPQTVLLDLPIYPRSFPQLRVYLRFFQQLNIFCAPSDLHSPLIRLKATKTLTSDRS